MYLLPAAWRNALLILSLLCPILHTSDQAPVLPPSLARLQECLDFASAAWCRLFCRLHGGELLLEALLLHSEALEQGQRQAEPAALAALQALHSLVRCAGLPGWGAVCQGLLQTCRATHLVTKQHAGSIHPLRMCSALAHSPTAGTSQLVHFTLSPTVAPWAWRRAWLCPSSSQRSAWRWTRTMWAAARWRCSCWRPCCCTAGTATRRWCTRCLERRCPLPSLHPPQPQAAARREEQQGRRVSKRRRSSIPRTSSSSRQAAGSKQQQQHRPLCRPRLLGKPQAVLAPARRGRRHPRRHYRVVQQALPARGHRLHLHRCLAVQRALPAPAHHPHLHLYPASHPDQQAAPARHGRPHLHRRCQDVPQALQARHGRRRLHHRCRDVRQAAPVRHGRRRLHRRCPASHPDQQAALASHQRHCHRLPSQPVRRPRPCGLSQHQPAPASSSSSQAQAMRR